MSLGIKGPVGSVGGGAAVSMPITVSGTPTATGIVIARTLPQSGTLQTWDLFYREVGALSWTEYATGLTGASQTVADLSPETEYQFYAIGHVLLDTAPSYAQATTGIQTAPTTPTPKEWVGSNLALQNSAYDVSFLGGLVGNGSATALTFAVEIKNNRGRKAKAARILVPFIEGSNGATISARFARKGTGSITAPQGAWSQAQFGAANSVTPGAGAYDWDYPWFGLSDETTITGGIEAGGSMVVWVSFSGGAGKRVSLGANNTQATGSGNWGKPSVYGPGNLCYGDYASVGASGTPPWSGSDYGNPVVLVQWIYDETDNPNSVVCGIAVGDSYWAGLPPLGQSRTEDWAEYTTQRATAAGKRYAIQAAGQGTHTIPQIRKRIEALLAAGVGSTLDFVAGESWSWNSPPADGTALTARIADVAAMKAACDAAGVAFIAGMLAPPGTGNAGAGDPFSVTMSAGQLTQFDGMRTHINAAYKAMDTVSAMENPGNLRHFKTTDSGDDVHLFSGSAGNPIGQYALAVAVGPELESALIAHGYTV